MESTREDIRNILSKKYEDIENTRHYWSQEDYEDNVEKLDFIEKLLDIFY